VQVVTFPGVALVVDVGDRSGGGVPRRVSVVDNGGGCRMQAAAAVAVT